MARPSKRRGDRDDTEAAVGSFDLTPASRHLFTAKADTVNFNFVEAGKYDPATYYSALSGNDTVVLPSKPTVAAAIGYDPLQTFHGAAGNDTITGGGLRDRINGGTGNDRLFGGAANDALAGADGHDHLLGGTGDDILSPGIGLDYVDAGDGDDIIVATEDDEHLVGWAEWSPDPYGQPWYRDIVYGGSGDDFITVTFEDYAHGGDGNDRIHIEESMGSAGSGGVSGGNGDDVILGSKENDWIQTGTDNLLWPAELWNAENKAIFGGREDIVAGGEGNDVVLTMIYCNATVDTGSGDDTVFVLGLHDLISMGQGDDVLDLFGGACKADLGDGNDQLWMGRAAWDNPNVSEVTLGAGADAVHFTTNEWFSDAENNQPLSRAPWILDFDANLDFIDRIWLTNGDDPDKSLNRDYIHAIDIVGGSALVYDDPASSGSPSDFCFARFAGVSADALEANIDLRTTFF